MQRRHRDPLPEAVRRQIDRVPVVIARQPHQARRVAAQADARRPAEAVPTDVVVEPLRAQHPADPDRAGVQAEPQHVGHRRDAVRAEVPVEDRVGAFDFSRAGVQIRRPRSDEAAIDGRGHRQRLHYGARRVDIGDGPLPVQRRLLFVVEVERAQRERRLARHRQHRAGVRIHDDDCAARRFVARHLQRQRSLHEPLDITIDSQANVAAGYGLRSEPPPERDRVAEAVPLEVDHARHAAQLDVVRSLDAGETFLVAAQEAEQHRCQVAFWIGTEAGFDQLYTQRRLLQQLQADMRADRARGQVVPLFKVQNRLDQLRRFARDQRRQRLRAAVRGSSVRPTARIDVNIECDRCRRQRIAVAVEDRAARLAHRRFVQVFLFRLGGVVIVVDDLHLHQPRHDAGGPRHEHQDQEEQPPGKAVGSPGHIQPPRPRSQSSRVS